jgi:hypothetical protein
MMIEECRQFELSETASEGFERYDLCHLCRSLASGLHFPFTCSDTNSQFILKLPFLSAGISEGSPLIHPQASSFFL